MKKILLPLMLMSLGVAGMAGTPIESNAETPVPETKIQVKNTLSNAVHQSKFKYMALADGVKEDADTRLVQNKMDASNEGVRAITTDDISSEGYKQTRGLKLNNQTLGVRFSSLANGCTLSFRAKMLSDTGKIQIRFDHFKTKKTVQTAEGTSEEAERAWYINPSDFSAQPKKGEWVEMTYSFEGNVGIDRKGMSLIATGSFIVDDFTLTDGAGYNYFCDGDFEPVECLNFNVSQNVGVCKQSDGSLIFGFNRWNMVDGIVNTSWGGAEERVEVLPGKAGTNVTASAKFMGDSLLILNRANPDWSKTQAYTAAEGDWQDYSLSFDSVSPSSNIYYGGSVNNRKLTYIKDLSLLDGEGNEILRYKPTKEGYAEALADSLNDYITCDGGVTSPDKGKWGTTQYCFSAMPEPSKRYIKGLTPKIDGTKVEQALYKYAYIVTKYKGQYDDYLGMAGKGDAKLLSSFAVQTSVDPAIYAVAGIGAVGVIASAAAVFLKKKKSAK